jgi:hypothetical protein
MSDQTTDTKTSARATLTRLIAEFQHRNESLHRHPVGGDSCDYCNIVGHYAVTTLLNHPEELRWLLAEEGSGAESDVDVDRLRFASSRCHDLARFAQDIPELVPVILSWDAPDGGQIETRYTVGELFGRIGRMIDEALAGADR